MHVQFNSMYMTTLKVAKNCNTGISGPKFVGIAQFGTLQPIAEAAEEAAPAVVVAAARVSGVHHHLRCTMNHLATIQMTSRCSSIMFIHSYDNIKK